MRGSLLTLCVGLLLGGQVVFAQSDTGTFTISVYGGVDITPPTTPTLLSVDPVAATQIDLQWSSSTDNFAVDGYAISRDGVGLATTSQLSYSDTGLTASTTYSYTVRAFDVARNYSTSSNTVATTTLAVPVTPPPTPAPPVEDTSSEGTIARVVVDALSVQTGVSTTSISLTTAHPARLEVRWGRTNSYELGYLVNSAYTREHATLLTDLTPGTTYEYEVIGYTPYGVSSVVEAGTFTTKATVVSVTPANVQRFFATAYVPDVSLTWERPEDPTIAYVRIVRSHYGFPTHPQDGAIVYQGQAEQAVDAGVLAVHSPVYYTAFVYDTAGNVSSGAVALVYAPAGTEPTGTGAPPVERPTVSEPGQTIQKVSEATSSINTARVTPVTVLPEVSAITVQQGSARYSFLEPGLTLDGTQAFTVSIQKDDVSKNLKTIIVSVLDPTDNRQVYSFLLRLNQDRSAYEATIAPLNVLGESQLTVEIYDFEAAVVASYQAPLRLEAPVAERTKADTLTESLLAFVVPFLLLLASVVIPIFIVWLVLLLLRRRNQGEDND